MKHLHNNYEQKEPIKENVDTVPAVELSDKYCDAVDRLIETSVESGHLSPSSSKKVGNILKTYGFFVEKTSELEESYEWMKTTFTTKKGFAKLMVKFYAGRAVFETMKGESWLEKKAKNIRNKTSLKGLEKDTLGSPEKIIDECSEEEVSECID